MYVPLLVRSAYSLFYGTRLPGRVVRHLQGLGYGTIALTDRNNIYGVHEFLDACKELGVRPILGATIQKGTYEVVVLVKERKGFSNLCRLLTRRMRWEDSFNLAGEIPLYAEGNAVLCRDRELLEQWQGKVEDLFVWIPTLDRSLYRLAKSLRIPPVIAPEVLFYGEEDPAVHRVLQAIGRLETIPSGVIPTTASLERPPVGSDRASLFYRVPPAVYLERPPVWSPRPHDSYSAASPAGYPKDSPQSYCTGKGSHTGRRGLPGQEVLPGFPAEAAEVEARFSVFPDALENTVRLADRCQFHEIFQGFVFPRLPLALKDEEARKNLVARMLRDQVLAGAEERYGELSEGVLDRIEYELSVIQQKGFSEYFLVVADIVRRSPRTCGRGSAAASVVAYCLGITNVDPIRHNLYFERFLNLEREDPPDIDVDFAWDERDGVMADVFRQYGEEHCARVCNHVFYRFPSALRDTARVFGIPEGEITAFEKNIRRGYRREGGQGFPGEGKAAHDTGLNAGQSHPSPWPEVLRLAKRITGLPWHLSVHSGGVVITPEPIDQYAPEETAEKGVPILTWEKDGVEAAGLVKIDLLGNRSLAVIRDALENVKQNGIPVGEGFRDPTVDSATQALLSRGDTFGVFYVESPAMRQLQAKTGKGDFEHLVIHSSIIRPAANRFINLYVRRLKGEPYQPLHPDLDRILEETYGILCYQEDVSKAAIVLAGFSNADADGLRKILSKKNKEARLARYREQFYEGALRKGIPRETIDAVWEMILSFEGYSFCKAHSASYAMVSFQSAYLKAHHPAEFMAAVLSNRGGYYTPATYISEARRMGLTILGPDVNQSLYRYIGRGKEIRVGFIEVKGLHRDTVDALVEERSRQPFQSVEDFGQRVALVGEDAEALVSVGALDSIAGGASRTEQLWILLRAQVAKRKGMGEGGALSLFEGESVARKAVASSASIPPANDQTRNRGANSARSMEEHARWKAEFERLGFLLEGHVLLLWEPIPDRYRRVRGKDLPNYVGRKVEMVGWPVTSKEILTREGRPMEFMSFEDESGLFETVLFPKAYERYAGLLDEPRPVIIQGTVQEDLGAVAIHVERLTPLCSRKNQKER